MDCPAREGCVRALPSSRAHPNPSHQGAENESPRRISRQAVLSQPRGTGGLPRRHNVPLPEREAIHAHTSGMPRLFAVPGRAVRPRAAFRPCGKLPPTALPLRGLKTRPCETPSSRASGHGLHPPFPGLVPPCLLGQYELVEKIGQGGMGCVYRSAAHPLETPLCGQGSPPGADPGRPGRGPLPAGKWKCRRPA